MPTKKKTKTKKYNVTDISRIAGLGFSDDGKDFVSKLIQFQSVPDG